MNRYIAIDPSTTITGWAVFREDSLVSWGKIDSRKVQVADRFSFILARVAEIQAIYRFDQVIAEDVSYAWHGQNRNRNIAGLQILFRSLKDYAKTAKFVFIAYNPASWKNAVVGHIHASKEVTKNNVLLRFPALPVDLTDHEYDAIGIGVYHSGLLKYEAMLEGQILNG